MRSRLTPFLRPVLFVVVGACGGGPFGSGSAAVAEEPVGQGDLASPDDKAGSADGSAGVGSVSEFARNAELDLFRSLNKERGAAGLSKLKREPRLDIVARKFAAEMLRTGVIAHHSQESGGPGDRAKAAGFDFSKLTENLARAPDSVLAHDGLMHSPSHRANILDPQVEVVGVGVVETEDDAGPALLAVQMFARLLVQVDAGEFAKGFLKGVNLLRVDSGAQPLKKLDWLDTRARQMLEGCLEGKESKALDLSGSPLVTATTLGWGIISPDPLADILAGQNAELLDPAATHVGVAIRQGTHKDHGPGFICVKAVVGRK